MVPFSKKVVIVIPNMWELPQITILRTNFKIVGTHTFRKFFLVFLHRTYVIVCKTCLSIKY
ncbi:hypothetical protein G436_1741 [Leptospira interrogans serovar Hardjo str. Norma]|uniref:Uncharacterized protein n=1 Tax=Leptospira interrogans serovar Hardjo str. Norma TaxID=1279460 RepID=A0A0M4N4Y0_LEPIR|nr:hypothetical protein G436_1741 [Leptospira interrogans serovar Hardjo str. Norma]